MTRHEGNRPLRPRALRAAPAISSWQRWPSTSTASVGAFGGVNTIFLGVLGLRPERRPTVDAAQAVVSAGWRGGISAPSDIRATVPQIMEVLEDYFVPTSPQAKTRCIDGRHDENLNEDELGPQVPGGAPGSALAYRLGVDGDDLTRGTFTDDVAEMISRYLRLGLAPGAHTDDQQGGGVGCGAIDNMASVLDCMVDSGLVEDHKRLVRLLLGQQFDRDHYLRGLGAGLVLHSRTKSYFDANGMVIELLQRTAPDSVTTLRGKHNEGLVIVNLVPGTTLSSNRFAAAHEGVQAFGYDLWRSRQLAEMLFPRALRPLDQERFIHARVMLTIATLMALTDGSLPLLMRLPAGTPGSGAR
ncbi:MAG: cadmium-containing carbonic anhydrase [Kineosporiaceae bacterium]